MALLLKTGENPLRDILIMKKYTLISGVFFLKNFFGGNTPNKYLDSFIRPIIKQAALGRNFLYRSLVTDKTMEKRKITKTLVTAAVKPLDSKITGAQVRDLTQTLIRLKERELARQEKRQTGKHLQDGIIKGLTRSIDLLKNLLQHGYNPGRYTYDERDFSYSRPARTLSTAQKEKNLANLVKAREAKLKLAAETRTDHD